MKLATLQTKEHLYGFYATIRSLETKKALVIVNGEDKKDALKQARKAAKAEGIKLVVKGYTGEGV